MKIISPKGRWKMKLTKRIVCLALAFIMCASFAGCGNGSEEANGKITKLKMILVGEKPAIYDEIYGKLNEMLRKDIGAEVEVEYYN